MTEKQYRERVLPNVGTFLAVSLLLPSFTLMLEPFSLTLGVVVGSALVLLFWAILVVFAPVIRVQDGILTAGKATIPTKLLGPGKVIGKEELFIERGPKLSPLAYKLFQGSVKTALRIPVKDPQDKTPYWLLSTRRPEELKKALKG
jgi:hypothetical protein